MASASIQAGPAAAAAGVKSMSKGFLAPNQLGESFRSQFFGTPRVSKPVVMVHAQQSVKAGGRLVGVRSASIFEKLVQIFSSNPADEEQVLAVYEINEKDRRSPAYLRLTPHTTVPVPCIGDLVPYSNKVYGPSGKDYLGLSAGLCTVIEHKEDGGDRYETTYTHYLGGYGQLSGMGPYYTNEDSEMVVTGGTGIFKGARGIVKIQNLDGPLKLLYTYYITGIQRLPADLTIDVVPLEDLPQPSPVATAPATVSA